MFLKLLQTLRPNEANPNRNGNYYFKERNEVKFVFYSSVPLREQDFPKAMEIIQSNVSKKIDGNFTAYELQECFKASGIVAVDIESQDGGKGWLIKLSDDPHAFID